MASYFGDNDPSSANRTREEQQRHYGGLLLIKNPSISGHDVEAITRNALLSYHSNVTDSTVGEDYSIIEVDRAFTTHGSLEMTVTISLGVHCT